MHKVQKLLQNLLAENKGKGKENLIKASFLFVSVCISTLIFISRDKFADLENYGYLGIFLLSILGSSTIVIPAPTFLATLVAGGIFNPFLVGVISAFGSSIGELTGYFAGYGSKVLIKESKISKKINSWMQKNGSLTILILAAIPNPFFDLAGISAGLTNYPVKKFLLSTFLGKSIKFILIALIGLAISRFTS